MVTGSGTNAVFDHVILATGDVDRAALGLRERFGLGSVAGGSHPWGTANRVVPLAPPCYLELLYVEDRATLIADPEGAAFDARLQSGDFWAGWALRVDDIAAVAERLGTQLELGETLSPDGSRSRWTATGPTDDGDGGFPFFIDYDDQAARLARFGQLVSAADHERAVGPIRWIEVDVAPSIAEGLAALRIDIEIRHSNGAARGGPGVRAIGLEIGKRVVEIR